MRVTHLLGADGTAGSASGQQAESLDGTLRPKGAEARAGPGLTGPQRLGWEETG